MLIKLQLLYDKICMSVDRSRKQTLNLCLESQDYPAIKQIAELAYGYRADQLWDSASVKVMTSPNGGKSKKVFKVFFCMTVTWIKAVANHHLNEIPILSKKKKLNPVL